MRSWRRCCGSTSGSTRPRRSCARARRASVATAETQLANHLSEVDPASGGGEELYRRAAAHGDDEAYNNLGVLLWDQGRVDDAELAFRRGAELGDDLAVANLAGLLEERRG